MKKQDTTKYRFIEDYKPSGAFTINENALNELKEKSIKMFNHGFTYSGHPIGCAAALETLKELEVENKGQSETLENMEGIVLKLIDRWNKSDEKLDRKFDDLNRNINDLDSQISRVEGSLSRINGKH